MYDKADFHTFALFLVYGYVMFTKLANPLFHKYLHIHFYVHINCAMFMEYLESY